MIQTVDNYLSFNNDSNKYYFNFIKPTKKDKNIIGNKLVITLKDYQSKSSDNTFFSFFKDKNKRDKKNEDELIISIKKDGKNYLAQTGNYVGKFVLDGLEIDIKSRFDDTFLKRMLNFANDIFLDDVISGDKKDEKLDISKFIIYYMFVQRLEKAFLLGLPKAYRSINHHDMKLKGKIDINRFIKNDIPFKGKISSTSREQREIQETIDVLYKAVKIIETKFDTKNISHIKTHLKQYRSNKFVSNETINKAINSKALQNPIFTPYKKVLEYARFIIQGSQIEQCNNGKKETYGFLINVAELFEIYITKLLQKEFSDWNVSSPQIRLSNIFEKSYLYDRRIIPDIVMKENNSNRVMVFDTKYKRMKFNYTNGNGSDIDRCDFFQINTYMNFYNNQDNLIVGGLLYPIEKEFDKNLCHSDNWFGNNATKFIIDGINLEVSDNMQNIIDAEKKFIQNIDEIINGA